MNIRWICSRRNPLLGLYSISYLWYAPIAVGTVIIVGLIVSRLTRSSQSNEVDRKLIISITDLWWDCLPVRARDWLQCDLPKDDDSVKKGVRFLIKYFC